MPFADVKDYCKTHNIPLTAVHCTPKYSEDKGRVTKGDTIVHTGWKAKGRYENNKVTVAPVTGNAPIAWMMSLKHAKMYVIDIDVKNDMSAKDILKPEIYDCLVTESDYMVETGSKGLHFYFKYPEDFAGTLKNRTNISDMDSMFVDGMAQYGSIDFITESIVVEGSSYSFNGINYKYIATELGSSINDTTYNQTSWDRWNSIFAMIDKKDKPNSSGVNSSIDIREIEEHLENIPNTTRDWDNWYKMGQTIFNVCGQDGYELFNRWSAKSAFYNEAETLKLWNGLTNRSSDGIRTVGSILYLSRQNDEEVYCAIRKKYAPLCYEALKSLLEEDHFFIEEPRPEYVRVRGKNIIHYTPTQFKDLLMSWNYIIEKGGKETEMSFFNTWSRDASKRRFKRIGFYPNASKCPKDEFNGCFPCRASTLPLPSAPVDIAPILNHIDIMANHDEAVSKFIIMFFAQILQKPDELPGIMMMFYAEEGAGKDILLNWFGEKILGDHLYYFAGNMEELFKNFNNLISGKLLIHCDELVRLDKKNTENLKRLITAKNITVNRKGVSAVVEESYARLVGTTNNNDSMNATMTDRRFLMANSSNEKTKDAGYFKALLDTINDDTVIRAFYDYLMKVDISSFHHTNRPETAFYKEMKASSLDNLLVWVINSTDEFDQEMTATECMTAFNNWAELNNIKKHNPTSFGLAMNKLIAKNIGFSKRKISNYMYTINRNDIMKYLESEGLLL